MTDSFHSANAETKSVQVRDFPAEFTVHWPTGPVHACDRHAVALRGLAGFLGGHVGVERAPPGSQCPNCINEACAAKVRP